MLRSYPANLMKLSPLFMEMSYFETIHCLNFNMQRQKPRDDINDVKVNFLICGFVGCMKNMLFAEKLTLDLFLPKICMI